MKLRLAMKSQSSCLSVSMLYAHLCVITLTGNSIRLSLSLVLHLLPEVLLNLVFWFYLNVFLFYSMFGICF